MSAAILSLEASVAKVQEMFPETDSATIRLLCQEHRTIDAVIDALEKREPLWKTKPSKPQPRTDDSGRRSRPGRGGDHARQSKPKKEVVQPPPKKQHFGPATSTPWGSLSVNSDGVLTGPAAVTPTPAQAPVAVAVAAPAPAPQVELSAPLQPAEDWQPPGEEVPEVTEQPVVPLETLLYLPARLGEVKPNLARFGTFQGPVAPKKPPVQVKICEPGHSFEKPPPAPVVTPPAPPAPAKDEQPPGPPPGAFAYPYPPGYPYAPYFYPYAPYPSDGDVAAGYGVYARGPVADDQRRAMPFGPYIPQGYLPRASAPAPVPGFS
jgi:hypothetical protein